MKLELDTQNWLGVVVYLTGDVLMWVFPWRRKKWNNSLPWYSLNLNQSFQSLDELILTAENYMYLVGCENGRNEATRRALQN